MAKASWSQGFPRRGSPPDGRAWPGDLHRRVGLFPEINFIDGASSLLVDTPLRPAPYVLTANHCIGNDTAATSITRT